MVIFVFYLAENRNSTKKVENIKVVISSCKSKDRQYKKDQETNNGSQETTQKPTTEHTNFSQAGGELKHSVAEAVHALKQSS